MEYALPWLQWRQMCVKSVDILTHWVTHICVSNLTSIVPDNGVRPQMFWDTNLTTLRISITNLNSVSWPSYLYDSKPYTWKHSLYVQTTPGSLRQKQSTLPDKAIMNIFESRTVAPLVRRTQIVNSSASLLKKVKILGSILRKRWRATACWVTANSLSPFISSGWPNFARIFRFKHSKGWFGIS